MCKLSWECCSKTDVAHHVKLSFDRLMLSIRVMGKYICSVISDAHDVESRFVKVVSRSGNCDYLLPGDFESMLQDVVDTHKGLLFLQEAKEFHSRSILIVEMCLASVALSLSLSLSDEGPTLKP